MLKSNRLMSFALVITSALFVLNCGESTIDHGDVAPGDPSTTDSQTRPSTLMPDTEYTRDLRVFDHVKPIDATVASLIQKQPSTLTFPTTGVDAAAYQVDDVVVSDYADGIFRVVEAVNVIDGQLVLTTRQAKLEDAVASGEIYLGKIVGENHLPPESFQNDLTTQGMELRRQALGFDKEFGWDDSLYEYDQDFRDKLNQRLPADRLEFTVAKVHAEIGAEVYAKVSAKLGWPPVSVPAARLMTTGKTNGEFRIKVKSDDQFSYDEEIVLIGATSQNPLVTVDPISHTLLPGIFPLKFTFEVESVLQVVANVDGEIEAEVGYSAVAFAKGGAEKKDGEWRWVSDKELVGNRLGPFYRGEKNLEAQAKLTNKVRLEIGEKASGFAELRPADVRANFSQQINADTGMCPTMINVHAQGSFKGQLKSIDLPIVGQQKIMGSPETYPLYDETLVDYNGQLDLPGICDPGYEPPTHAGTLVPGEKCGGSNECISTATCYKNTCVTKGKLRVSTSWTQATDADIFVQPPGEERAVSYSAPNLAGGDLDFTSCYLECTNSAPHVESVFFDSSYPDGTYSIWLRNHDGKAASPFEFEVEAKDAQLHFQGELPAESRAISPKFEFEVSNGELVGGMSTM